jgi:hypothetical protein
MERPAAGAYIPAGEVEMLNRRTLVAALPALAAAAPALAAPLKPLTVYKAAGCSCCEGWVKTMWRAGFAPKVVTVNDLSVEWRKRGVPDRLSSCHMGLAGGYVLVGHVPPAIGLSVPGMPDGSPGMERADGVTDAYDTLLLLPGGRSRVWAHHG